MKPTNLAIKPTHFLNPLAIYPSFLLVLVANLTEFILCLELKYSFNIYNAVV